MHVKLTYMYSVFQTYDTHIFVLNCEYMYIFLLLFFGMHEDVL